MSVAEDQEQVEAVAMSTSLETPAPAVIVPATSNGQHASSPMDETAPIEPPTPAVAAPPAKKPGRRRLVIGVILAVLLVYAVVRGVPSMIYAFTHESTDDATVNGHVTFVSPRVDGVILGDVVVDDNQFVEAGAPLVRLDPATFQNQVDQKAASLALAKANAGGQIAALQVAQAELDQARDQVRSQIAGVRGAWYLVSTVQDLVKYESAALRANVATYNVQAANLGLAQTEYDNGIASLGGISKEEMAQRQAALKVAQEQLQSSKESIQQTRALLELPPEDRDPASVPADKAQTFAGTKYALASAQQLLSQLGLGADTVSMTMTDLKSRLEAMSVDAVVEHAPAVRAAQARVGQALASLGGPDYSVDTYPAVVLAQKELDDARLQLSYTNVVAPVAGFVSGRSVNKGDHVTAGQNLLSIRPLNDVWVDANFKETQLQKLRIGQKVDLEVDAYPGKVFHGRVSGFGSGTGAVDSLLPPENATGNFVKVVQRLTVRIDLLDANDAATPLLAGLSVVPSVDTRSEPTGDNAGQRLTHAPVAAPGRPS